MDIDESLVVRRPIHPVEHLDLWLLKPRQRHAPLVVSLIEDLLTEVCANIGKKSSMATVPA